MQLHTIMTIAQKKSLIKDSTTIRRALQNAIKDSGHTNRMVAALAKKKGIAFSESNLSRYLNSGNVVSALSEENILWLCKQYKIFVGLSVVKSEMVVKKKI